MYSEATGDKYSISPQYCYIGLLALAENRLDKARASFRDGLDLAYQADIKIYIVYNLIGIAKLFMMEDQAAWSASLLAAARKIAKSINLKIESELQEPYDRVLEDASQKLSGQDFRDAWEAGEKRDIEQAVKFALEN